MWWCVSGVWRAWACWIPALAATTSHVRLFSCWRRHLLGRTRFSVLHTYLEGITLAIIDRFPLSAAAPCGKRCGEDLEAAVMFRTVIALLGVPVDDPWRVVCSLGCETSRGYGASASDNHTNKRSTLRANDGRLDLRS
ncbi:hypothetical protein C2S52_023012 [Perilla frutescens var. hirtella]|nr:hypothetical protein C2S52_023012 [Perilla frutescens var. hirtella]